MVAGRRAYERELRFQRQMDRDIEMACMNVEGENEDVDEFLQLALLDAQQQELERHEENLFNENLAMEEEEELAQELFMIEVYPALLEAEATRRLPSDTTTGASSSEARPASFSPARP